MRHTLLISALVASALVVPAQAGAASPDVVISEVYGGGGNQGATLKNDFVELYNHGTQPVTLEGWSVQYASAAGTRWQVTELGGSIEPGRNYLVKERAGAGGTQDLPKADATGSIAMAATSGKVALVRSSVACAGASCTGEDLADFVGFGGANAFEGLAPAPGLSNPTSDSRKAGGSLDTDQNGSDFTRGDPSPRNAAGQGPGAQEPVPGEPSRIHDVQGPGHVSPVQGKRVEVPGVVTAVSKPGASPHGYWIQDPSPDADPRTSEGILVFGGSGVSVGDSVIVTGTVKEHRGAAAALSLTELTDSFSVPGGPAAAIEPTLVGPGGLVPPTEVIEDDPGNAETGEFEPGEDGIDWHESLEGMLVRVNAPGVVGPTNRFAETATVPEGIGGPFTPRGGIVITPGDFNPERMIFDDVVADVPAANTGDAYAGPVDAVVDYTFNNYKYYPTAAVKRIDNGLQREVTEAPRANQLAISSMNVENLDPGDPEEKFAALAQIAVTNLRSPDILAVEEIQDNDGPGAAPSTNADVTYTELIEAIEKAGGPRYEFRQIDPNYDTDGGQPVGNIRVGFLYRTDRGLRFVDRPGATANTPNSVVKTRKGARLAYSPGRIDPMNVDAFRSSRKPLAAEFLWKGRTVFAIANHFNSKGGGEPLFGRHQPPTQSSTVQRHKQANVVAGFVEEILDADPRAAIAVMGDLNDFQFSETLGILEGAGLTNLMKTLPADEQYSYVFDGNSQVLDQILVSDELLTPRPEYDSVHVNAEFDDQASDHDPQVARVVVRGTGNANGR